MSSATFFSPMPRKPPTPTINGVNLAALVEQHVDDVADMRVVGAQHVGALELRKRPLVRRLRRRRISGWPPERWSQRRIRRRIGLRKCARHHQRTDGRRDHELLEHSSLLKVVDRPGRAFPCATTTHDSEGLFRFQTAIVHEWNSNAGTRVARMRLEFRFESNVDLRFDVACSPSRRTNARAMLGDWSPAASCKRDIAQAKYLRRSRARLLPALSHSLAARRYISRTIRDTDCWISGSISSAASSRLRGARPHAGGSVGAAICDRPLNHSLSLRTVNERLRPGSPGRDCARTIPLTPRNIP